MKRRIDIAVTWTVSKAMTPGLETFVELFSWFEPLVA